MLVYNPEIWSEYRVQLAKSDCTGFRITSDIAVTTGVVFGPQQACNTPAGCPLRYTHILPNKAYVRL